MENNFTDDDLKGENCMSKKFIVATALVATTFSAGLVSNVANASQAPAPKAPILLQQDKKDVKPPKAEPQKKDVKKQHKEEAPQPKDNQPLPKEHH